MPSITVHLRFYCHTFGCGKNQTQAQKNHMVKGKYFVYCNGLMDHICVCENGKGWYKAAGQFKGTLDAFYKIVCCEGVTALWSGLPPTL
ncbi:hypothetical protein ATANTOWER_031811 [Ataeniobius toweri]|uniref:Uncharacterized protein n=1 Tax=Ataeniobius toweri TaxID=208326 RepID=A0ABU7B967_9TELE|nr:hypothetical protein [Ataeniobius toweri]